MDETNKQSFEGMCSMLLQKDFIIKNKEILEANGISNVTDTNVRTFCSSYLINGFPNEIFGVDITQAHVICKACYLAAQELHIALAKNKRFQEEWNVYINVFNEWKTWDLNQLKAQYQSTISLLDLMKTENSETIELTGACDILKDQLSQQIQMLTKSDIVEVIESLSKVQISQDIENAVTRHVYSAYWDSLHEHLMKDKFSEIGKIIQLEKDILLSICTKKSDKEKIEEILDADFICQLLTHDCYDKKQLTCLLLEIYNFIQSMGPPCDDDGIEMKKAELAYELQNYQQDKSAYMTKCITYFRDILERSLKIVSIISELYSTACSDQNTEVNPGSV